MSNSPAQRAGQVLPAQSGHMLIRATGAESKGKCDTWWCLLQFGAIGALGVEKPCRWRLGETQKVIFNLIGGADVAVAVRLRFVFSFLTALRTAERRSSGRRRGCRRA